MNINYKEYTKNNYFPVSIHTPISNTQRISSIYRRYENPYFQSWGWETFLWENNKISEQYQVLDSVENVINLHCEIISEINNKTKE